MQGWISKAGDGDVWRALYEATSGLLTHYKKQDKVKSCGLSLAKPSSHRKATVAVVRKLRCHHARDVGEWHVLLRQSGRA